MPHFVMTCDGVYPSASIKGPRLKAAPWMHGRPIENVPVPLNYSVDPLRPGNLAALYAGCAYPLMRDDLVAALQAAGVDNLQLFDAVVQDPTTGRDYHNFKGFNIVGVVAAADMEKSVLMGTSDAEMISVGFDRLAIDEKRAGSLKLFRLAENVGAIIVDEFVKQEVTRREIPGMVFYDPTDWSG